MSRSADRADDESLDRLLDVLEVARAITRELSEDALLGRLLSVYQAMPADDRPVIIGVLEREVLGRHLSRGTEKAVGQSTYVNPHARLYVRAHETQLDSRHFDLAQMHVANVRAMRVSTIIRNVPGIHALFKEAIRSALGEVDEPTRDVAEALLHDVLAAFAEARAGAPPADAAAPAGAPPAPGDAATPAAEAATGEPGDDVTGERPRRS